MPVFTGGGSSVGTAEINDGAIVNVDVNAAANIALTKLAGLIGNPGSFISIEQVSAATTNVTVDGNTRILILAKGHLDDIGNETITVQLRQQTVVKDTVIANAGSAADQVPFALMYSEVPANGTYTVDVVEDDAAGGASNVKIIVIKLRVV